MRLGQHWLVAAAGVVAAPGMAADMTIKVTLPEIPSQGMRPANRPYVAIWLRKEDNTFAADLAVWYQIEARQRRGAPPGGMGPGGPPPGSAGGPVVPPPGAMGGAGAPPPGGMGGLPRRPPENPKTPGGARWLNEVRQWWADSGNRLQFPVDGLTSASRAAGTHELTFAASDPKLAQLPPGKYKLMVEASREHGGDETVSIPLTLPLANAQSGRATGKSELGAVELIVKP